MDIRKGENKRESWWVTNNTNNTITIGDLLLLPALKPGKKVDLLYHYTREKISHSTILPQLVKSGRVSLSKDKLFTNEFPGPISVADIDDAITPMEENEMGDLKEIGLLTGVEDPGSDNHVVTEQGIREALLDQITEGDKITDETTGAILYGKDLGNEAAAIGISGEENNEVLTMDLDITTVLEDILIELIKANIQMAIMTGNEIRNREINLPI